MNTHNICFCGEIRKILLQLFLLSGAMNKRIERKGIERKEYFSQMADRTDGLAREIDSSRSLPMSKSMLDACCPR